MFVENNVSNPILECCREAGSFEIRFITFKAGVTGGRRALQGAGVAPSAAGGAGCPPEGGVGEEQ